MCTGRTLTQPLVEWTDRILDQRRSFEILFERGIISFDVHLILDLTGEPFDSLVKSFPGDGVGRANVPGLVRYPLQSQHLKYKSS